MRRKQYACYFPDAHQYFQCGNVHGIDILILGWCNILQDLFFIYKTGDTLFAHGLEHLIHCENQIYYPLIIFDSFR